MELSPEEKAAIFHLLYSDLMHNTKREVMDRIRIERGKIGIYFTARGLKIQEVKRNLLRRLMKERDFPNFLGIEEVKFPEVEAFLLGLDELISDETLHKWAKGTEDEEDPHISKIAEYFLKKRQK
jgi:hypothetical protein